MFLTVGAALIVLMVVMGLVFFNQKSSAPTTKQTSSSKVEPQSNTNEPVKAEVPTQSGQYVDYDEAKVADEAYSKTIVFFYAPWCPECRAFDKALKSGSVPQGVQILKIDYDSNQELRKKYGVTLQTTFVEVSSGGEKKGLWVGYGKDKSANAIIENTK